MSVVINGMEMPKNCFNCQIRKSCEHAWYLSSERPDDCPLVEVCGFWRVIEDGTDMRGEKE